MWRHRTVIKVTSAVCVLRPVHRQGCFLFRVVVCTYKRWLTDLTMLLESDAGTCLHEFSQIQHRELKALQSVHINILSSRRERSALHSELHSQILPVTFFWNKSLQTFCVQRSWNTFDGRSSDVSFEVFLNIPRTIKSNILKLLKRRSRCCPELMACVENVWEMG